MSNDEEWLDIWGWIAAFPPVSEWETNSMPINFCRQSQLPLLLTAEKETLNEPPNIILSLRASFEPNRIVLWKSNAFNLVHADGNSSQDNPRSRLFSDFIDRILKDMPPQEEPQYQISEALAKSIDSKIFNCAFILMALSVSVYEAPIEIRPRCLEALDRQWRASGARNSFKLLLQAVGSNNAQLVMRSMGFTLIDRMASDNPLNPLSRDSTIRSPLSFSQSYSTKDEWKFQVYAPVFTMEAADEKPIKSPKDVGLLRALGFLHLEACLLLKYSLNFTGHSIEVHIGLANVICNVFQLLPTAKLEKRVAKEKHFPSRISVKVTLLEPCNISSAFASTCTNNKSFQLSRETNSTKGSRFEIGRLGLKFGYSGTSGRKEGWATSFEPWMFEQAADVSQGKYLYSLSDINTGEKVTESRPSQKNNGWFKNNDLFVDMDSYLPCGFNAEGGIAKNTKEWITWNLGSEMEGKTLKWKVEGEIWVTYWPNKYKGSYSENRRMSFSEILEMVITR